MNTKGLKTLRMGDRIKYGVYGVSGTVLRINKDSVRIVFDDGTIICVKNLYLFNIHIQQKG